MASPRHVTHDTLSLAEFVERPEVARLLHMKHPSFFDRLTPLDLEARGHLHARRATRETLPAMRMAYKQAYVNSVVPFSPNQKLALSALVDAANNVLGSYKNILTLPWRFAKLEDHVENGFPHTHADVIFLHDSFFPTSGKRLTRSMLKIIVHEKLHVFQRAFPAETKFLVRGLWRYRESGDIESMADARNNPDTDGIVYAPDGCRTKGFYMAYRDLKWPLMTDTFVRDGGRRRESSERFEHPFERMAYQIADLLVDQKLMDESTGLLMRWTIDYL